jgi:3-oxoacid CoA-transferase subunit A
MNKIVKDADEAIRDIKNGSTIMLGGFGLCGIPENCIAIMPVLMISVWVYY